MKIAILGAESTHAKTFASQLAGKDGSKLFPDVELVGVYADKALPDSDAGVQAILKNSACQYITDQYDKFVEQVDGVMITSRHGSRHLEYASPYLEKGIPVWIDKPICSSIKDAVELVRIAGKYDTPVCGGSSLVFSKEIKEAASFVKENRETIRGGHVTAPIHMDSEYDGFWFYAQHAIQMMLEVFGMEVRKVAASRGGKFVQAVYEYDDFSVSVYFGTGYTMTLYKDNYHAEPMKISTGGSEKELEEFYHIVKDGHGNISYNDWILPVFLIDATIKAYEQNKLIDVDESMRHYENS